MAGITKKRQNGFLPFDYGRAQNHALAMRDGITSNSTGVAEASADAVDGGGDGAVEFS
jgi:hypothetical protein